MAREKERFAVGVPQTDPPEAAKWNTYEIIITDADALRHPADIRVAGFSLHDRSAVNRFANFSAAPKPFCERKKLCHYFSTLLAPFDGGVPETPLWVIRKNLPRSLIRNSELRNTATPKLYCICISENVPGRRDTSSTEDTAGVLIIRGKWAC
jgi:hypothetical protein